MAESSSARTKVFVSYSHKNKEALERLKIHLAPLRGSINYWDDTHIKPGDDWRVEIQEALDAAKVAVLLVSPEFLASKFITEYELPHLLAAAQRKGVRVLPVILSHCLYEQIQGLGNIQAVNNPATPLLGLPLVEQDKEWLRVAQTIFEELNQQTGGTEHVLSLRTVTPSPAPLIPKVQRSCTVTIVLAFSFLAFFVGSAAFFKAGPLATLFQPKSTATARPIFTTPTITATPGICGIDQAGADTKTFTVNNADALLRDDPAAQADFNAAVRAAYAASAGKKAGLVQIFGGGPDVGFGINFAQHAHRALLLPANAGFIFDFQKTIYQDFGDTLLSTSQIQMTVFFYQTAASGSCSSSSFTCGLDKTEVDTNPFVVPDPTGLRQDNMNAQASFNAEVRTLFAAHAGKTAGLVEIFGGGAGDVGAGINFAQHAKTALLLPANAEFIFDSKQTVFQTFADVSLSTDQMEMIVFFYVQPSNGKCSP